MMSIFFENFSKFVVSHFGEYFFHHFFLLNIFYGFLIILLLFTSFFVSFKREVK
ncbi:hypothetical protein LbFV_ORF91 [Leptopilina boulardi filamentous virus]|uniref:Uncharacterized protein n=1 Tax=Leptopilina boulardi filamentous virus TaxID=552509 RepID=A0A1S5YD16_9VIRU|nr:hypothetical protein LbFV_ORF91 [Leptopilina boulardi filamentous virus]AQQ80011.1 hypothetical protein LbFV_ORF91 [Leptopilina boulardi filamentous virus]